MYDDGDEFWRLVRELCEAGGDRLDDAEWLADVARLGVATIPE